MNPLKWWRCRNDGELARTERGAVLIRKNGRLVCAACPYHCAVVCEPCEFAGWEDK